MWGHENGDGEKRELTFQRQMGEESLMVELLVCQWQKGNTGNKRAEISAMLSFFSSPDLRRTKNKRKAEEQVRIIGWEQHCSTVPMRLRWGKICIEIFWIGPEPLPHPHFSCFFSLKKSLHIFKKICNENFWSWSDPIPNWKVSKNSSDFVRRPGVPLGFCRFQQNVQTLAMFSFLDTQPSLAPGYNHPDPNLVT